MDLVAIDARGLAARDRIMLVGRVHRVVRVRQLRPGTEMLHEIEGEPGLICTAIPQGARINLVARDPDGEL